MSITREAVVKINADTSAITTKLRDVNKEVEKTQKQGVDAFGKLSKSIRNAFIGIGVIQIGKELMELENTLVSAKFAVAGLDDPKNFVLFKKQVNDIAKFSGKSQTEVADMAVSIGKSGTAFKDLEGDMMNAVSAGINWDMSAKDAASSLATQKAILQFTTAEMRDYASMISYLADQANAAEVDIVEMNTRILGTGKDAGFTANEVTALSTMMLNLGVGAERGSTALASLFGVMMSDGKKGTKGMEEVFESLAGIADETERFNAIEKTFGTGLGAINIKKIMDYTTAIKNGTSKAKDFIAIQKTGQKDANQMFNAQTIDRLNTTSAELGKLKATLFELAINVGEAVLPVVNKLAIVFTKIMDTLLQIPSGFGWTAAAAIGIGFVLSKLVKLYKLLKAFRKLQKALLLIEKASLATRIMIVALTNPIALAGLTLAGLGAVGGVGYMLAKEFNTGDDGDDAADEAFLTDISSTTGAAIANTNNNQSTSTNNNINVTQNINGVGNPSSVAQNSTQSLQNLLGIM